MFISCNLPVFPVKECLNIHRVHDYKREVFSWKRYFTFLMYPQQVCIAFFMYLSNLLASFFFPCFKKWFIKTSREEGENHQDSTAISTNIFKLCCKYFKHKFKKKTPLKDHEKSILI